MRRRAKRTAREESMEEPLLDSAEREESPPHQRSRLAKRRRLTLLDRTLGVISFLLGQVQQVAYYFLIPSYWRPKPKLTEEQKGRLSRMSARIGVEYDENSHGGTLKKLWELAFPETPFVQGKTPKWKDMGWQSDHPSSDFRGAGYLALENLVYFAEKRPLAFRRLCFKTQGHRSDWEYPFGAAGVNVSFALLKICDLKKDGSIPSTLCGHAFLRLLKGREGESQESVFEEMYCMTFELLDKIWLEDGADYMQFSLVMDKVESALQNALRKMPLNTKVLEELLLG